MADGAITVRACGGCTLCCKVMKVMANDGSVFTDFGEWCKHAVVGQGCRIYADPIKPTLCARFRCLWQVGWGEDEDRPDRSKIVGSLRDEVVPLPGEPLERILLYELRESTPGAFESSRGRRLVELLPTLAPQYNALRLGEHARMHTPVPMELVYFDGRAELIWKGRRYNVDRPEKDT
jgi:hypothetical protein